MYLLDTNVVSELRRANPNAAVVAWFRGIAESSTCISAVTVGEIQAGIEITREQDAAKAAELAHWLDEVVASHGIVPMDAAAFREWARLKHRRSDSLIEDVMIAATARVHGFIVATRNVRDFAHFDVEVVNPFDGG